MKKRTLSFALLTTILGVSIAWAQIQSGGGQTTTTTSQGNATAEASTFGNAQAGGNAQANGSASGYVVANGMMNGQKVYVVDYAEKSANTSATDASQSAVKDHDQSFMSSTSKAGQLVMAGQYMDDGKRVIVILAKDDAAAEKLAYDSPLVKSGYFSARVRPFHASAAGGGAARGGRTGSLGSRQAP